MDDAFMERIVVKKKSTVDILIISGVILASIIAFFAIPLIPYVSQLWVMVVAGILFGAYYLIRSRNIEFEYIVTNGDLDIDKIIARRKRKRIFSASCKNFDVVARLSSEHYNHNVQNIKKRIESVSSLQSENVYFATLSYKNERTVVFFEPDERMLKAFKTYIPKKILG